MSYDYYYSLDTNHPVSNRYTITKKETELIEAAADWIISNVKDSLNPLYYETQLLLFKDSIRSFLTSRFESLGCANLRTVGSNTQLCSLACNAGIPLEALPEKLSVIVNRKAAFYYDGPSKRIIMSY